MPRWIERRAVRFACEVRGAGPTIVLLHGLGGGRGQAMDLAGELGWRRVAIDLRAHGETEPARPPGPLDFGTLADDVAVLLDALDVETAVIAGVSMGAGVAARLALEHPDRVDGLVCVRPAWLDQPAPENLDVFPQIADLLRREGPGGLATFRRSAAHARIQARSGAAGMSFADQFLQPLAVERADRLDQMPSSVPFADIEDLERLRVPALVVGCELDPIHPRTFADAWAAHLRGAVLVDVTPKSEDPVAHQRDVVAAIGSFLRDMSDRPTGG